MRFLLLADIHGRVTTLRRAFEEVVRDGVDAAFVAGDISSFTGRGWREVLGVLSEMHAEYGVKSFVTPGNSDPRDVMAVKLDGVTVLHKSVAVLKPYVVAGVGGGLGFPFLGFSRLGEGGLRSAIKELLAAYGAGLAPYSWVLLTHSPPYGTPADRLYSGIHAGSKAVRELIVSRKPLLAVCGHIHESRGVGRLGGSTVVNPGPNYRGFYAVAEAGASGVPEVNVLLRRARP